MPRRGASRPRSPPKPSARPSQQSRPASTSAAPRQAPAPSSVPAKPAAAAPPAAAPPAAAPAPQAPGFFAGMAQIAGGVAMGHAITGAVGSLMSSGDNDDGQSEQQHSQARWEENEGPCAEFQYSLSQCLDRYGSDISACQFAMDALNECRASRFQ